MSPPVGVLEAKSSPGFICQNTKRQQAPTTTGVSQVGRNGDGRATRALALLGARSTLDAALETALDGWRGGGPGRFFLFFLAMRSTAQASLFAPLGDSTGRE
jgi:hypothetical protein